MYLGPNRDGTRVLRFLDEGDLFQQVTFRFFKDTDIAGGSTSTNLAAGPLPSIGFTGCTINSTECGPDNEDGRGLLSSATLGGTEWLVLGGGRTAGDLDYVYMVSDAAAPLAFRYVDLSEATGPETKGFSASHGFDRYW